MLEKSKTIKLLRAAGKIYFYLYGYEERHKHILSRGVDLLFYRDISFLEKVLLVYARLTKRHSKRIAQVRIKYSNAYNYSRKVLLKTIYDSFEFSKFITLPFSEDHPNPDGVIKWFFYSCNEIFYSNIYKLDKLLEDNDTIIDGGGNIGLFSLYAKNLRENISCLVFEPEINNFKALKKNLENYKNIKFFNEGLSNTVSEANLLISDNVLGHKLDSELIDFDLQANYYDSQKIRLNTIDNVVFSTKIKKIDLIKLDIEGSKLLALKGMVKTMEKYNPLLLVAVEHSNVQKPKIIKFFKENFKSYSYIELNDQNVLFYNPKKHLSRINKLEKEK